MSPLPVITILPVMIGKALPPSVELSGEEKPKRTPAFNVMLVSVPELLALLIAAIKSAVLAGLDSSMRSSKASRVKRFCMRDAGPRLPRCRGVCPIQRCRSSFNHMVSLLFVW